MENGFIPYPTAAREPRERGEHGEGSRAAAQ